MDCQPEGIFMHFGHNDLMWHHRHNQAPKHPMEVLSLVMGYVKQIEEDFPSSSVYVSNLFPRTVGPNLTSEMRSEYYQMVYQYGRMIRDVFPTKGIRFTMISCLWYAPSQGREHPVFFRKDGLHQ